MSVLLEVCVASLRDALVALDAGAKRIELNCALELGGLTPATGLTERVVQAARQRDCRVIAMVRPRPGGFAYDPDELDTMRLEIDRLIHFGVDGVALGVLEPGGTIAFDACRALIEPLHASGREAVFHRAFDLTPDPHAAFDTLIDLGFDRVLTSGQAASAIEGASVIRSLIDHAADKIQVLPGGGIRPLNVAELIQTTGCTQVHASLRSVCPDASGDANPTLSFNAAPPPGSAYSATDGDHVVAMVRALGALGA